MTKETKNRELNVHLPQGCIAELSKLGQGLDIGPEEVLALAWELGKQALLARTITPPGSTTPKAADIVSTMRR